MQDRKEHKKEDRIEHRKDHRKEKEEREKLDKQNETADHIRIRPDLSDLKAWILWCRDHDDICKKIAENAKKKVR